MQILIVDDSPIARDTIASLISLDNEIEIIGYAENGQEAILLNDILNPSLILMDVEMPKMDGIEATRQIMASNPKPIVILTAVKFDGVTTQKINDVGAVWIIEKPQMDWSKTYILDFCAHLKFLETISIPKIK